MSRVKLIRFFFFFGLNMELKKKNAFNILFRKKNFALFVVLLPLQFFWFEKKYIYIFAIELTIKKGRCWPPLILAHNFNNFFALTQFCYAVIRMAKSSILFSVLIILVSLNVLKKEKKLKKDDKQRRGKRIKFP